MILTQKYLSFIVCLFAGMLYALGFPIFNGESIFIAPIFGFALFNWALDREVTFKKQLLLSFVYSLGFYLLGFYWIPYTLNEFGGLFFPFNQMLGLLFSLVIIPQVYFYVILKRYVTHPLFLALGYVLLEQYIPQQFPAHLGHSYLSLAPLVKLVFAPWAGGAFYSFFTALVSLTLLQHFKTKQKPKLYYGFILVIVLLHLPIYPSVKKEVSHLNVRIVQPNIGNFIKLDSERGSQNSLKSVYDTYYFLSTDNVTAPKDLIIWPETAFPGLFFSQMMKANHHYPIPPLMTDIMAKTGAELFIGGYDSTPKQNGENYQSDYNTALHFSNEGYLKEVYHKMHLIPFGEGLPFGPFNKFLSGIITNISYFAEGDTYTGFTTRAGQHFVSVICYEVLFPHFVADMLNNQKNEAQFLVNLTNDSWYGETAEPYQHLFLSKWRALEFNLPLIRSTNTGITTVIYPDGSETKRLGVGEKTYLDLDVEIAPRTRTLFQVVGVFGVIGVFFILCLVELAFKRKTFFKQIMKSDKT
ncbi:MAG: apolipoprotein N-acyltransferase [Rhizobacter sp.]|nr:apolipoprotein N-acyltransferase [Bacteriovorax sp.]